MTEALDFAWTRRDTPAYRRLSALQPALPATQVLLTRGGDARIEITPGEGVNRYGCPPLPAPDVTAFASSTASIVSSEAFVAADRLRSRLVTQDVLADAPGAYARELDRIRCELTTLCGLDDLKDLQIAFAASGTDLHLIVGELLGSAPLVAIGVEPGETGGGIGAALAGRHFSTRTALGGRANAGEAIGTDAPPRDVVAISCRGPDGSLRPDAVVEQDLQAAVARAVAAGARVLLVITDVSKTGLISPSLAAVAGLRDRWPDEVDVLVDACQFRLTPRSLRAYLEAGFLVAVTGSKFLTGPTFSGALLASGRTGQRLGGQPLSRGLRSYCARAEWPGHWAAAASLPNADNLGLLLRWEAALCELRAFRAVPEDVTAAILGAFAHAVQARLSADPAFEPLAIRAPDRRPLLTGSGWDEIPTIFPFLLRAPAGGHAFLDRPATDLVYRALRDDGLHLGQPVACGEREGAPVSAVRLCASARLVVEAHREGAWGTNRLIRRAMDALDRTAMAAMNGG